MSIVDEHSLFARVGGGPAVKAVVEKFYTLIIEDVNLAPFFEGVDMALLKKHQYAFLEIAFTKIPDDLDVAKLMLDKHQKLFDEGLNEKHFDMVAGHLVASLNSLQVSQNLIDEVVGVVGPLRPVFEQGAKDAKRAKELQAQIAAAGASSAENGIVEPDSKIVTGTPAAHGDTLFVRLGGGPAVRAVVSDFYKSMVSDPKLAPFFEGVDIGVLKKHQYTTMELAFTDGFGDVDVPALMIEKHMRLFGMGLDETHFDIVASHLIEAMEKLGVSKNLSDEVIAIIGPLRSAFAKGALDYRQANGMTTRAKNDLGYWD